MPFSEERARIRGMCGIRIYDNDGYGESGDVVDEALLRERSRDWPTLAELDAKWDAQWREVYTANESHQIDYRVPIINDYGPLMCEWRMP